MKRRNNKLIMIACMLLVFTISFVEIARFIELKNGFDDAASASDVVSDNSVRPVSNGLEEFGVNGLYGYYDPNNTEFMNKLIEQSVSFEPYIGKAIGTHEFLGSGWYAKNWTNTGFCTVDDEPDDDIMENWPYWEKINPEEHRSKLYVIPTTQEPAYEANMKADELCKDLDTDYEKVLAIYTWVTENFFRGDVTAPDDSPFKTDGCAWACRGGLCGDLSSILMTMFRSQNIPCVQVMGGNFEWNLVWLPNTVGGYQWYPINIVGSETNQNAGSDILRYDGFLSYTRINSAACIMELDNDARLSGGLYAHSVVGYPTYMDTVSEWVENPTISEEQLDITFNREKLYLNTNRIWESNHYSYPEGFSPKVLVRKCINPFYSDWYGKYIMCYDDVPNCYNLTGVKILFPFEKYGCYDYAVKVYLATASPEGELIFSDNITDEEIDELSYHRPIIKINDDWSVDVGFVDGYYFNTETKRIEKIPPKEYNLTIDNTNANIASISSDKSVYTEGEWAAVVIELKDRSFTWNLYVNNELKLENERSLYRRYPLQMNNDTVVKVTYSGGSATPTPTPTPTPTATPTPTPSDDKKEYRVTVENTGAEYVDVFCEEGMYKLDDDAKVVVRVKDDYVDKLSYSIIINGITIIRNCRDREYTHEFVVLEDSNIKITCTLDGAESDIIDLSYKDMDAIIGQKIDVSSFFVDYTSRYPGTYRIKVRSNGGKATISKNVCKGTKAGNVELYLQRKERVGKKNKWVSVTNCGTIKITINKCKIPTIYKNVFDIGATFNIEDMVNGIPKSANITWSVKNPKKGNVVENNGSEFKIVGKGTATIRLTVSYGGYNKVISGKIKVK